MRTQPGYLPTPSQIEEECAYIRTHWSITERERRLVDPALRTTQPVWLPPQIDTSACGSRVRKAIGEPAA